MARKSRSSLRNSGFASGDYNRAMRFPIDVTKQARCPVCKKAGPGTNSPVTPRPETVSLSFTVLSTVIGQSRPVFLGSTLMLGWDSGVTDSPKQRVSKGASFNVAMKNGKHADVGTMDVHFCSTKCLRSFLDDAVTELERRMRAVEKTSKKAKTKTAQRTRTTRMRLS
jgi:hypothetical protein